MLSSEQLNAMAALAAVVISPLISIYVVKKEINSKVLSENRQAWINQLRERVATFLTLCKRETPHTGDIATDNGARADRTKQISQLANEIALFVNPMEADHSDLVRRIRSMEERCANWPAPAAEDAEIVDVAQKILKREWERVKGGK
jgi:hypothetical protein